MNVMNFIKYYEFLRNHIYANPHSSTNNAMRDTFNK